MTRHGWTKKIDLNSQGLVVFEKNGESFFVRKISRRCWQREAFPLCKKCEIVGPPPNGILWCSLRAYHIGDHVLRPPTTNYSANLTYKTLKGAINAQPR